MMVRSKLTIIGIASLIIMTATLSLHIWLLRISRHYGSTPMFFYDVSQIFIIAILILGMGCIKKNMNGVGIVFTAFQIYILTSLLSGGHFFTITATVIISSFAFIESTQSLAAASDLFEPHWPTYSPVHVKNYAATFLKRLAWSYENVEKKIATGLTINIRFDLNRFLFVWTAVGVSLALSATFIGTDQSDFIAVLFLVLFPMSMLTMMILKKKTMKQLKTERNWSESDTAAASVSNRDWVVEK